MKKYDDFVKEKNTETRNIVIELVTEVDTEPKQITI
jgi:hypothetical protein